MLASIRQHLRCPATPHGNRCLGSIDLAEHLLKSCFDVENDELEEGILICRECGREFPIVCGMAVLADPLRTYLTQHLSELLVSVTDFHISQDMKTYLRDNGSHIYDRGFTSDSWSSVQGLGSYILAHHDDLHTTVGEHEPIKTLFHDLYTHNFYDQVAALVNTKLTSDHVVLDLGCNVGGIARRLASTAAWVYAVDISFPGAFLARRILRGRPTPLESYVLLDEGLGTCTRNLSDTQRKNVDVAVADGSCVPFPNEFFDYVVCCNVIELATNPEQVVSEMFRTLKRGGHALVTTAHYWRMDRTPIDSWLPDQRNGHPGRTLVEAIESHGDITERKRHVPWVLRKNARYYQFWLCDCILVQKV